MSSQSHLCFSSFHWLLHRDAIVSIFLLYLCFHCVVLVALQWTLTRVGREMMEQFLTNPYIHRHGFLSPLWQDRAVCLVLIGPIHHGPTVREMHKEREGVRLMFSFISCLEETCSQHAVCNSLSQAVNYYFMGILVNQCGCVSNALPLLK